MKLVIQQVDIPAADIDTVVGVITYTQWLNADGRLEADLTVTRLAPQRFLVVASDTAHAPSASITSTAIIVGLTTRLPSPRPRRASPA